MEILETYRIVQGDSLHSIAQKMYGDISRAMEIALANDLRYPFISGIQGYEEEGVKSPGDMIIIPREVKDEFTLLDSIVEENALGSDLLLQHPEYNSLRTYNNGDFAVTKHNDLETVEGLGSLKQDLIHRLITKPGTLICHPTWGSNFLEIIGNKNLYGWREKATIEIERCFRSDDRVIDIRELHLHESDSVIIIQCEVVSQKGTMSLKEILDL